MAVICNALSTRSLQSIQSYQIYKIKIDRFHFKNHIDKWCKANMNPADSVYLKDVNTEIMEQTFAWLKGFAPSLRYMKRVNYLFVLIDMIDRHNMEHGRSKWRFYCTICVLYTSKSFCDNHKQKKFCVSKKKSFLISVQKGALDQRNDAMCGVEIEKSTLSHSYFFLKLDPYLRIHDKHFCIFFTIFRYFILYDCWWIQFNRETFDDSSTHYCMIIFEGLNLQTHF